MQPLTGTFYSALEATIRIDARGPACGDQAREQRHRQEHDRDTCEREWISRRDSVKQTNHDARQ